MAIPKYFTTARTDADWVLRRLQQLGAVSPEKAVSYSALDIVDDVQLVKLLGQGRVKEGRLGSYYLVETTSTRHFAPALWLWRLVALVLATLAMVIYRS